MTKKLLTGANIIYHLNREVWMNDTKHTLTSLSSMMGGKHSPKVLIAGLVGDDGSYAEYDVAKAKIESRKEGKAFNFKDKKAAPEKAAKKKGTETTESLN